MRNTQHIQNRYMRYVLICTCVTAMMLLAGCGWGGKDSAKGKDPNFRMQKKITQPSFGKMPVAEASEKAEVPDQIREAQASNRFLVYKIKLPLSVFSGNEKIWRMVDEDSLDSQTSLMLAQNGIRAAVLPQANWPAVAKQLQGYSAWTEQFTCRVDSGIAIELQMRVNIDRQTVFYIDRDLNLQGRTFERCDNKFRLVLSRAGESKDVVVSLEPVVSMGTTQVVRAAGDMTPTRDVARQDQSFENLRLWAKIRADQALILSPTHMKDSPFSVGSQFLADLDGTPPSELVLVLVPQK